MGPRKQTSQAAARPRAPTANSTSGKTNKLTHTSKKSDPPTTTQASRKRHLEGDKEEQSPCPFPLKRPYRRYKSEYKISRGSLWREDQKPKDIEAMAKALLEDQDSPSHETWGITSQNPIAGNKRKKHKRTTVRQGANGMEILNFTEMMEDIAAATRKPIIPNTLERSPILRIALEVRERIYAHLLIYDKPVLLKPDLTTLERNTFLSHALVLTCKQFAHECTSFLYQQNTFQALFRPSTHKQRMYDDLPRLQPTLHHLFRHVALDFAKQCWSIDWFEKTAACLNLLSKSKPMLETLTLMLSPMKEGMSTTAQGMRANPTAFADFLWDGGAIMQAVSKLCPRTLKVVVKKGRKKFEIKIDMWCLKTLIGGFWEGANEIGLRRAEDKGLMVREELADLQARFEEVFENEDEAVAVGRCKVLGELEGAGQGVAEESQKGGSVPESSVAGEAGMSGASASSSSAPLNFTNTDLDSDCIF